MSRFFKSETLYSKYMDLEFDILIRLGRMLTVGLAFHSLIPG